MYYSKQLMDKQNSTMFPSKVIEDYFTDGEFEKIKNIAYYLEEINQPVEHSGQTYTKFNYYESDLHNFLNKKIQTLIGDHFVYLATIADTKGNPVLVHTDHNLSDVRDDSVPYATICIPLDVIGKNNNWGTAATITFDQWYFPEQDWEYRRHIFTDFLKPNTLENAVGFKKKLEITKEFYNRYLSQHSSHDFFEGMSIEGIFKWKKQSIMLWHQCRFHCSDSYGNADTVNKKSIILWTTKDCR